jgi:hypothetical protein
MYSNPSPYGLSISVESVLSMYVEHVSRNWIVKSPNRFHSSLPSCDQLIRLVAMSSNSHQAFHERSALVVLRFRGLL